MNEWVGLVTLLWSTSLAKVFPDRGLDAKNGVYFGQQNSTERKKERMTLVL